MDAVISKIADEMKRCHYQFKTVSIEHLPEIQNAVGNLVREGTLDEKLAKGWQFYRDNNIKLPEAKTIFIVVSPQVAVDLHFKLQGQSFHAYVPPGYFTNKDDPLIEAMLKNILETAGYKLIKARLPLKTLAVSSGLAKYGRNNITYVPGMGSGIRLAAFYTDFRFAADNWQSAQVMSACKNCTLCRDNCPTGCIPSNRFLIHAEKCLTYLNEYELDFPAWVNPDWHNAIIGCSKCQEICPVNKPYWGNIETGPSFSEEETKLILNRTPEELLNPDMKMKLGQMIEDGYCTVLGRNLRVLIDKQKKSQH